MLSLILIIFGCPLTQLVSDEDHAVVGLHRRDFALLGVTTRAFEEGCLRSLPGGGYLQVLLTLLLVNLARWGSRLSDVLFLLGVLLALVQLQGLLTHAFVFGCVGVLAALTKLPSRPSSLFGVLASHLLLFPSHGRLRSRGSGLDISSARVDVIWLSRPVLLLSLVIQP